VKQKTIITLVGLAGLMLCAIFFVRSCGLSQKLREKEHEYIEYRAVTEESFKVMSNRLDALTNEIALKDKAIVEIESALAVKNLELSAARAELSALQNAEPATTPEEEALPIVINLRGQISKLNGMVTLVQDIAQKQAEEIVQLKGKVTLLEQVGAEWKGAYEREHTLRLQAEDLYKVCSRSRNSNGLLTKVALGVAGAGIIYGLLK